MRAFSGNPSVLLRPLSAVVAGAVFGLVIKGLSLLIPAPPVAQLRYAPKALFPGDTVIIENVTEDDTPRCALWVTTRPWPSSKAVAGKSALSFKCPEKISFTIPIEGMVPDYWAHLIVESQGYRFVSPNETPSQIQTKRIEIDLTPQATISFTPIPGMSSASNPQVFLISMSILLLLMAIALIRFFTPYLSSVFHGVLRRMSAWSIRKRRHTEVESEPCAETDTATTPDLVIERLDMIIDLCTKSLERNWFDLIQWFFGILSGAGAILALFGIGR